MDQCTEHSHIASTSSEISSERKDVRFSFGTIKANVLTQSKNILGVQEGVEETENEADDKKAYKPSFHFENGQLSSNDEQKNQNELVIPLVLEKDWRTEKLLKMKSEGKLSLEEEARFELLNSSDQQREAGFIAKESGYTSNIDADYDSVPIEMFGLAILKGCGWKEGDGIGKSNKRVVPLIVSSRRPKGLGLGAIPMNQKKTAGVKDGPEELKVLKKSSCVKIISGIHRDLYGKVESFDEDNASVIVQLALNQKNVRVSRYAILHITAKEYERDSKCINKRLYDDVKMKHDLTSNDVPENTEVKSKKLKIEHRKKTDGRMWVCSEIKVRFIDKKFKHGKLYNEKVRVLDAADRENITIQDNNGGIYYQVHEDWLETLIPKSTEKVMIVSGQWRGQVGIIIGKNKNKETVIVRLAASDDIVKVSYNDACEFVGSFNDHL